MRLKNPFLYNLIAVRLFFIFLVFSFFSFGGLNLFAEEKNADAPKNYNLIVLCLDSLRADHLGCYGYPRNTTPHIDSLARSGILFEWAISQSSFTLPSIASFFTSEYAHEHHVDTVEKRLAADKVTLAEICRQHGYKTAAFIHNAVLLDPKYGLNKGFDAYEFGYNEKNRAPSFEITMPQAVEWISKNKADNFFVFLHANDIHEPYHCPDENFFDPSYKGLLDNEHLGWSRQFNTNNLNRSKREKKHIIAHYDAGIRYADTFIPRLRQVLKQLDLADKTILVIFSDHGEILGEQGERFCHGWGVSDVELRVPLIIVHPALYKKGLRIKHQIQLIDIMPTLLDFLGLRVNNVKMSGKSLLPLIEGRAEKDFNKYVYAQCFKGESEKDVTFGGQKVFNSEMMVRTSRWKLIYSVWQSQADIRAITPREVMLDNGVLTQWPLDQPAYRLYDLGKDPREENNLIEQAPLKIRLELLGELASRFHEKHSRTVGDDSAP